jgi:hypothetical protein
MFYNRIKKAEKLGWEDHNINFELFWEARKETLPIYLRLEDNKKDPGLCSEKQNWYREYGIPPMMDKDFECFKNGYNDKYYL